MDKYYIRKDYTIKEAIEKIDGSKDRAAVVLSTDDKVIGVISQGDIIRALMSGKNLYTRVGGMIRPDFLYLNSRDMARAYTLFRKLKITLLPVVDNEFQLTDIINMDDIYSYMEGK